MSGISEPEYCCGRACWSRMNGRSTVMYYCRIMEMTMCKLVRLDSQSTKGGLLVWFGRPSIHSTFYAMNCEFEGQRAVNRWIWGRAAADVRFCLCALPCAWPPLRKIRGVYAPARVHFRFFRFSPLADRAATTRQHDNMRARTIRLIRPRAFEDEDRRP